MVKPLRKKTLAAEGEALKRYHEARTLLSRVETSFYRDEWEDGETVVDVIHEIADWLSHEKLEEEIFGKAESEGRDGD